MNHPDHDSNGIIVDTTPLFASSLLALFYVLRQNYYERRLASKPVEQAVRSTEE